MRIVRLAFLVLAAGFCAHLINSARADDLLAAKAAAEQADKSAGPESAEAATAWQRYADVLGYQDRKAEAAPIIRKVLAIRLQVLGESNRDTAYTLNQLGWALETTEGNHAAEEFFRRALAVWLNLLGPDDAITLYSLGRLGSNLYNQSKHAEAEPYLRRAAEGRFRVLGSTNPDTARSMLALGDVLHNLNRNSEAVIIYGTALTASETAFGPDTAETALILNNLGFAKSQLNQLSPAIENLQRAVAICEKLPRMDRARATSLANLATALALSGKVESGDIAAERSLQIRQAVLDSNDLDLALSLNQVAFFRQAKGEFAQAENLASRALAIEEKQVGPENENLEISIELLMTSSEYQGKYSKALELGLKGLAARKAAFGDEDPQALRFLLGVARNEEYLGRYYETESAYRRVLYLQEKLLRPDDVNLSPALTGLGDQLFRQLRYAEAKPLYQRALDINVHGYGEDHFLVAVSLARLGRTLKAEGNYSEAEADFQRGVSVSEKAFGDDNFFTAMALEDLADVYDLEGKVPDAISIYERTIASKEKTFGPNHPNVGLSLGSYASLLWKVGRVADAEAARKRELAIDIETFGLSHTSTATSFGNLAWLQLARGEWPEAVENYRLATDILIKRGADQLPSSLFAEPTSAESELGRNSMTLLNYIHTEYWAPHMMPSHGQWDSETVAAEKTFKLIQWARLSDTSMAVSQMALRVGSKDPTLAARIREIQDLKAEWRVADAKRSAALAQNTGNQPSILQQAQKRLSDIESCLTDLNAWLRSNFPEYAELSLPQAVSAEEARPLLKKTEALVFFSLSPADCFVWVVNSEGIQWNRLNVSYQNLTTMIGALREQLLGGRFNLNLAYNIYQAIFSPIEKRLEKKDLLVISSGVLTSLPLSFLINEKPQATNEDLSERYRHAAWMIRSHAITMLPSVSALKSLRQRSPSSDAVKPYLGIGNPLLYGRDGSDRRARSVKDCSDAQPLSEAILANAAVSPVEGLSTVYRGATVDVNAIRQLDPLPETVSELCGVAASFGESDASVVIVGERATEKNIRRLNRDGVLANARIVHFATHGLVAGELKGMAEPALVLTPPDDREGKPTPENDGLLTASEIAQLDFNADWIVLSACNTAAGNGNGAEALSGLARAFFYAGTRALLVSNWTVNTSAAVKLMVQTFRKMAADKNIGRAEAVRRAMIEIIDNGSADEVHPRYWAPFMIVGEGSLR